MLMDLETYDSEDESTYSLANSTNNLNEGTVGEQVQTKLRDGDLGDFLDPELTLSCQTRKTDPFNVNGTRPRPCSAKKPDNDRLLQDSCPQCKESPEKLFHVNYDTILKLKESTRKLLCVLEEIQSKTHSKHLISNEATNFSKLLQPSQYEPPSVTDVIGVNAIKKLEAQAKTLDSIYIEENEDDDCSIYKRLTRRCNCLNHDHYNDFVIHFNENTKYRTSVTGEIIKNMRILKKFLYMNGGYTKNALLFLNEGMSDSAYKEKVDIVQGCAHADMCNIFEEHSIVIVYISWPFKNEYFGDSMTQALTSGFLYKLAQLEEGRRYLNYSSKISNDIKKVLRKKTPFLEYDTVESLNATLNLLNPPLAQNCTTVAYYCKSIDEGMAKKTVLELTEYRQNMTLEEIFTHLDILYQISKNDRGKIVLLSYLPTLIILFKRLIIEFDNSEMNITVTNILNNIVSKNVTKEKEAEAPKTLVIADVATEPIVMKHQTNQIPIKKPTKKGINKSKITLGTLGISPNKFRNASRRKVVERQSTREPVTDWAPSGLLRSRKFSRDVRSSVIVVPIDN